jgi:hypothetical protein
MAAGTDRVGVMVVRIWIESSAGSLRARITETPDLSSPEQVSHAAATVDEIVAIVRAWVEAFAATAD